MRFLIEAVPCIDKFNQIIRDGKAESLLNEIMGELKPEAVYFMEKCGKRCAVMVVNLNSASEIPKYAEPWFLKFDADVKFHPVMLPEDLAKAGLVDLAKKWG